MALKNGLALATQAREQSDDEIIQVRKQIMVVSIHLAVCSKVARRI